MAKPHEQSRPAGVASADLSPDALAQQAAFARQVIAAEAAAVAAIPIEASFHEAAALILAHCGGTQSGAAVLTGVGKSGLIARKLAATFASTGTPSHFLHPTEAMHGDLGRIRADDVVIALSYGGQTEEVVALASLLRQDDVPVIALVSQPECDLARLATLALCVGQIEEACPLHLAPTTSTTAMLAMGDALALTVMRQRNFQAQDFHRFHPGGSLGRQLMPVTQAMRFHAGQNLALIAESAIIEQAYAQAEALAPGGRRAGALVVVNTQGRLAGIFTDGDLRRTLIRHGSQAWRQPIATFMTRSPRRLDDQALVRDAVKMVREHRIDEIPVVDAADQPAGLIDVQDLVALKVIEH